MLYLLVSILAGVLITSAAPNYDYRDAAMFKAGYFQGDIADFDPFEEADRNAVVNPKQLWPNGIMYYKIDSFLKFLEDDIIAAMKEYETKTCIRFRKATSATKDYVNIAYMNGCWSKLGRKGGKQDLSLDSGCHEKGTIMHELGHALGFMHEQSRSDRDEHLEIFWDNIEKGQEPQFIKMKYYDNNLLEEEFDYKSIMLYGEHTFSKDGTSPTVRAKKPGVVIGPTYLKEILSESDVNRVNKLYQCFGMQRPNPPQAPDIICDLEEDDCDIVNEYGSTSFRRRFRTLGGRASTVYVVDAEIARDTLVGLKTPTYQLYGNKEGCFSFDYFFNGRGFYYFNVFKGSERLLESKIKSDSWQTYKVSLTEDESDIRFYIGGTILGNHQYEGTFAVDNIALKFSPCT